MNTTLPVIWSNDDNSLVVPDALVMELSLMSVGVLTGAYLTQPTRQDVLILSFLKGIAGKTLSMEDYVGKWQELVFFDGVDYAPFCDVSSELLSDDAYVDVARIVCACDQVEVELAQMAA